MTMKSHILRFSCQLGLNLADKFSIASAASKRKRVERWISSKIHQTISPNYFHHAEWLNFRPMMDTSSIVRKTMRSGVTDSWKTRIPNRAAPTAPMPTQMA